MGEIFLAYAAFILILASPVLVGGLLVCALCGGAALLIIDIIRRKFLPLASGAILVAISLMVSLTLVRWATTPPDKTAPVAHHEIFKMRQAMEAREQAMKWMRDGTFERLAEERNALEASTNSASQSAATEK